MLGLANFLALTQALTNNLLPAQSSMYGSEQENFILRKGANCFVMA